MSNQLQLAHAEPKGSALLAFGVGRVPAFLAALGFSLGVWRSATDGNNLFAFLAVAIGVGALNLGMDIPQRGKEGLYALGLLLIALFGSLFLRYAVASLLPDDFTHTFLGVLTQQAVMASTLYIFFRRVIPVNNPRLHRD